MNRGSGEYGALNVLVRAGADIEVARRRWVGHATRKKMATDVTRKKLGGRSRTQEILQRSHTQEM